LLSSLLAGTATLDVRWSLTLNAEKTKPKMAPGVSYSFLMMTTTMPLPLIYMNKRNQKLLTCPSIHPPPSTLAFVDHNQRATIESSKKHIFNSNSIMNPVTVGNQNGKIEYGVPSVPKSANSGIISRFRNATRLKTSNTLHMKPCPMVSVVASSQ
jgi:hypothetical protein